MDKEAFFGHHLRPLSWQSPSPETTTSPPAAAFIGLNWEQSMGRSAGGGFCNSGEISPSTKMNISMMDLYQNGEGVPIPGNSIAGAVNLASFAAADTGFAERAARSSCFAGGGFAGQLVNRPEAGKLSRAPSSKSLKWENLSSSSDLMTGSGAVAAAAEGNSRKRKAAAKCKGREAPSSPPPSNKDSTKSPEEDGDGKKRNSDETTHEEDEKEGCGTKLPEPQKDYVHVRARRGQATDSHSLAERVRREKISERMKFLQDLVPGCSKVTGKAVMLDEIINYVQSLQRQVEFLSMKLATVNPRLDFGTAESFMPKDIHQARGPPLLHSGFSFAFPSHQEASLNGGAMATSGSLEASMWQTLGMPPPPPPVAADGLGGLFDASAEVVPFWEDDQHSVAQMGFS